MTPGLALTPIHPTPLQASRKALCSTCPALTALFAHVGIVSKEDSHGLQVPQGHSQLQGGPPPGILLFNVVLREMGHSVQHKRGQGKLAMELNWVGVTMGRRNSSQAREMAEGGQCVLAGRVEGALMGRACPPLLPSARGRAGGLVEGVWSGRDVGEECQQFGGAWGLGAGLLFSAWLRGDTSEFRGLDAV